MAGGLTLEAALRCPGERRPEPGAAGLGGTRRECHGLSARYRRPFVVRVGQSVGRTRALFGSAERRIL